MSLQRTGFKLLRIGSNLMNECCCCQPPEFNPTYWNVGGIYYGVFPFYGYNPVFLCPYTWCIPVRVSCRYTSHIKIDWSGTIGSGSTEFDVTNTSQFITHSAVIGCFSVSLQGAFTVTLSNPCDDTAVQIGNTIASCKPGGGTSPVTCNSCSPKLKTAYSVVYSDIDTYFWPAGSGSAALTYVGGCTWSLTGGVGNINNIILSWATTRWRITFSRSASISCTINLGTDPCNPAGSGSGCLGGSASVS